MSLESKSKELKELVSTFETQWFLGNLVFLMENITDGRARDQLGKLSSPMRQLYYLGGLLLTSGSTNGTEFHYSDETWYKIIDQLNEIEKEYDLLFFPKVDEAIDDRWLHTRKVAIPSFLSYFNLGPLNFEEQTINWVRDLYTQFDSVIESSIGLKTGDFIQFYENLDQLHQKSFSSFTTQKELLRPDWEKYSNLQVGYTDAMPADMKDMFKDRLPLMTYMADPGIISRFSTEDLASVNLPIVKVNLIIELLCCSRTKSDFLYYTSTKPGNPLYGKPIVDIGKEMYQVFEVKQVIHAVENLLEEVCSLDKTTKFVEKKGKLLESKIVELFKSFLKKDYEVFTSYFVDGCEQDILFLWKEYAFIIEAKGYNLREPLRDPDKAFIRIKDDFKASIGYGYTQTKRVEQKFIDQVPLRITDNSGKLIKEIDTTKYEDNDFSIIVNLKSFGQVQNDLSALLDVGEEESFPWAVKLDDLEVFLLTMMAQNKNPVLFIDFLFMREKLHGKLICSDELEVCGGFLSGKITNKIVEKADLITTTPDLAFLFDDQYKKEMGFKNEKLLVEKRSGNHIFW
jgi:hypothetical protein